MLLLFSNPRVGLSLALETAVSAGEDADLIDVGRRVHERSHRERAGSMSRRREAATPLERNPVRGVRPLSGSLATSSLRKTNAQRAQGYCGHSDREKVPWTSGCTTSMRSW